MQNVKKIMSLGALLMMSSFPCLADDSLPGWDFTKDKDGVKIFTRKADDSKFKDFHAIVKMKTTVKNLVDLYLDVNRCADWLPDCKSAKIVEKLSETKLVTYTEVNNPWPIKNRDYVLQINLTQNSSTGEAHIDFTDLQDTVPENKCCVRMGKVKGFWNFTPADEGYVIVTYEYQFHPGGDLPVSAVNSAVPDLAYDTLTKMKKYIENTK